MATKDELEAALNDEFTRRPEACGEREKREGAA